VWQIGIWGGCRADWTVQQLWVGYLAVGGARSAFDIEAYLCGLGPLSHGQQDVWPMPSTRGSTISTALRESPTWPLRRFNPAGARTG
jgi:hypothetical protein